jgi:outer membrane protein TolC
MVQALAAFGMLACLPVLAVPPAIPKAVPIGLEEAIRIALESNFQVGVAQATLDKNTAGIQVDRGRFDWTVAANGSLGHYDYASSAPVYTGGPTYQVNDTLKAKTWGLDLNKAFTWGGSLTFAYTPSYNYNKTTVINGAQAPDGTILGDYSYNTPLPWTGALTTTYTQNLLQGFGTKVTTANLVVAQKNAQAATLGFRQTVTNLISATESHYWDLVYAERFLDNKRAALRLAQELLEGNRSRQQAGAMAEIEVASTEAQVAQADQDLIAAEAQWANAEDALRQALGPKKAEAGILVSADAPPSAGPLPDEGEAIQAALATRLELQSLRIAQDVAQLQATVAADKTRPQLSLFASYNGSTDNRGSLGPLNADLSRLKYPGYTVGFKFSATIQNNAAKGALSQARANLRGSDFALKEQEAAIGLQVRTALRNLSAAAKGMDAAERTRRFQERSLEGERQKLTHGLSTSLAVLQVLASLDTARTAELQARIAHAKASTALALATGRLAEARHLTIQ